jgi:hypothetical protein
VSDLSDWNVYGPVWTLRREFAEWDPVRDTWQAPGGVAAVTFRPDGQVSERESHNPDGSIARWACIYDDAGRIIEAQAWRNDGPRTRVLYSYDEHGRLDNADQVAADGTRRHLDTYRYDDTGRKTKITSLAEYAGIRHVHYSVEGTDMAYSVPGAATLTVTYDDRELPAEATFHDSNGGVIRRVVFSRDGDGQVLTEVQYFGGQNPFPERLVRAADIPFEEQAKRVAGLTTVFAGQVVSSVAYAHDSRGRLLERTMQLGSLSEERTTFQYDDFNNPIAETWESRKREVDMNDGEIVQTPWQEPGVWHNRLGYQYDARRNWIERVTWSRTESQPEFQRSSIERRTITYYEM